MRWIALALLAGCSPAADIDLDLDAPSRSDDAVAAHLPPPTEVTLSAPEYVTVDRPFDLVVDDALAGERVYFITAGSPGDGPCPRPLGGYCLDLSRPVAFAGSAVANDAGVAALPQDALPYPGSSTCFQAVIIRGLSGIASALSNVECIDYCADVDADGDGRCDAFDTCFGDAELDTDADGVCDDADPCPLDAPDDSDGDSICDSDDACPGFDDAFDSDDDGIPDDCDAQASCQAQLEADPSSPSGVYEIDPDGAGGEPSFSAYCDMDTDGGGWTLVWKMHHQFEHANDGPAGGGSVPCDFDPFEFGTVGAECNIPLKWTKFAPSDIRLMTHDLDFPDPITFDYKYTEPGSGLDSDNNILPYTSPGHFVQLVDNCSSSSGVVPTTDSPSAGYWMDKASPGSAGNWDIDLRDSRFDANCSRQGCGGPGCHRDNATTVLFVR